jgi:3-oxoadipate enol-lactonase
MTTLRTFYSTPQNKHSLVLLHAFPFSSSMWESAAKVISEHTPSYNIIFVDLPGFGDAPFDKQWTIGESMVELHKKLNEQNVAEPVIGGLSMGGYAAFAYYRLYQNEVKALVLSNTKAAADTDKGKKGREEFAKDVEARGAEAVYDTLLPKLVSASSKKNDPDLIPRLKAWIAASTPKVIATGSRALALRMDSTDLLEIISCPTLLITGEEDALIKDEEMEAIAAKIKGSKFISFMKSGHLTAVEYPEKWGSVVSSFLNVL